MQQDPRPPTFVPLAVRAVNQERGSLFGLVLFLASCLSLVGTMAMVMGGAALLERFEKKRGHIITVEPKYVTYLILLELVGLACIGGTWMWKRWGIYGYFAAQALIVLVSFKATGSWPRIDLVMLGAMAVAAFPRLHMFE